MSTPKSTEDLTQQIEQLVAQYVAESRRAVRDAVERAFGAAAPSSSRSSKPSASTKVTRSASGRRRSPEEVSHLGARLLDVVRARPGESMVAFAAELEMDVRELQRPMTLLRRDGRVRSVGQRDQMRYFPALGKTASAAR
jgi:predicted Zn-dependent protease